MSHPQKPQQEAEDSWVGGKEPGGFVANTTTQFHLPNSYVSEEGDAGEIK